jgi:hypothetical protein
MRDLISRLEKAESGSRDEFMCAICQRQVDTRWNHLRKGLNRIEPPVCCPCEREYSRGIGKPASGSFKDRRNVAQGVALAEALRCEAARMTWSATHG